MKKILLTTSALTLLAGAAAADVSIGGYGRLGIQNSGSTTTTVTRTRISFSGGATSDGGLSMSAWTRYQNNGSDATGVFSAPRVSISNGAMTLTTGNAAGAVGANSNLWGCGAAMWGCSDVVGGWDWASTSSGGAGPSVTRLDMSLGSASVSVSGGNTNDTEASVMMSLGGGTVGVGYDAGHATAAVAAVAAVVAVAATTDGATAAVAAADAIVAVAADIARSTISINYSGTMAGLAVGVRMSQSNSKTGYMANIKAPVGAGDVYVFAGKTLLKQTTMDYVITSL